MEDEETGDNIRAELIRHLQEEFHLNLDNYLSVTADGGSNMKKSIF